MDFSAHFVGFFSIAALTLVAIVVRTSVFTGIAFLIVRFSKFAQNHKVFKIALDDNQLKSEIQAACGVVLLDALAVTLLRYFELVQFAPPTLLNSVLSFIGMFIWFEIWFYVSHRLLHTKTFYWIHRQHHVAKVTDPVSSISFSLLERLILIAGALGAAALVSYVVPLSLYGLAAYGLVNYVLNIIGHSNVEIHPAGFARTKLGRVFATTSYHSLHHARYKGHYGLFTPLLDRWCGTIFDDYEAVQERAARGEGLERLSERVRS